MRSRWHRALGTAVVLAVILLPVPARAACHIADFTEHDVNVDETGRRVTLTVHLVGGQPSCAGTVRYETVDGTAEAPGDYEHAEGLLTFVVGDDREERITVRIRDDDRSEGNERFEVRLRQGQGSISPSSTPAVVTIDDDERAAASPTPDETTSPTPTPSEDEDGGSSTGLVVAIIAGVLVLGAVALALARGRST